MSVVMGTAGHVDHGKTTLIRALTNIDCDRLAEEKKRGITIELGFAYLDSPQAGRIGIVDVPGHEKFIRSMVAGASGIDFVMLVVAADEGIMPQTREHVDICSLLGIKAGFVALTKIDTVDKAWLDLILDDIAASLRGTFLDGATIVPVSASTGEGLENIRSEITRLAMETRVNRRRDLVRLPIDRVFSLKGHGTVVTGTLVSGTISIGEDIVLLPRLLSTKVRSIQNHGVSESLAEAGTRVAVNLADIEVSDISRGDVLARPNTLFPSERWLVRLSCLKSSPISIKNRSEVHFHHQARETTVRIYLLEQDVLESGQTTLAEVRFTEAVAGVFGDTFVMRSASPLCTIAGGVIVNPLGLPIKRREFTSEIISQFMRLPDASALECLLTQIEFSGRFGIDGVHLSVLANIDCSKQEKLLTPLLGSKVFCFDKEKYGLISLNNFNVLKKQCYERMENFHLQEPLKSGLPRDAVFAEWGDGLPPKLAFFVVSYMIKKGKLTLDGDVIRLSSHNIVLKKNQTDRRCELSTLYNKCGLTPPSLKDALASLNWIDGNKEAVEILRLMIVDGEIVKIAEGLYCSALAMNDLKKRVRMWFETHDNLDVSALRDISGGLSRKYLIAYLEYFDRDRFTLRVGDVRRLRRNLS